MGNEPGLLELQQVSRSFGGVAALSDVTFAIPAGQFVGILGPNGAGKTTLFNVITGVFPATRGRIRFGGQEVTALEPYQICRVGIGRTWQSGRPFESLSVLENAALGYYFGARGRRADRKSAAAVAEEAVELVGLADRRHASAKELNVLQRKMLELARCIAAGPRLLLLDEILAGLNPGDLEFSLNVIKSIHRERSMTILWIEHIVATLMGAAEHMLVLHHGELLAQGTPEQIRHNPKVIDAYLGGSQHADG